MSKKIKFLFLLPSLFLTGFVSVPPDVLTSVTASNREINRLICPERIKDVIYSQEKPVELKINDTNLFLKFLIGNIDGREVYYEGDLDMYVLCGESTYHLLLRAGNSPSQTILLKDPVSNSKKSIELFKGMPHEARLLKFLKIAYTENYPSGFDVKDLEGKDTEPSIDYPGAKLLVRRSVRVDGEGLFLKEYLLTPDSDIEVRETDFLKLATAPLLISLEKNLVKKDETVRLFIIESLAKGGIIK